MRKQVKIGDKYVEMLANGATPVRFKQLFKKDLLRIMIKNSDMDEKRRRILNEKAAEFRSLHDPEEVKRLIEERKKQLDEQIRKQEEITGQSANLDEVQRYTNAVDSLALDLVDPEVVEEFETKFYESYETTIQLAYIMAEQAAATVPSDMSRISMDTYYKWLEQFEPNEIEASADEIMAVYNGNTEKDPEIEPKKDIAGLTEITTQQSMS